MMYRTHFISFSLLCLCLQLWGNESAVICEEKKELIDFCKECILDQDTQPLEISSNKTESDNEINVIIEDSGEIRTKREEIAQNEETRALEKSEGSFCEKGPRPFYVTMRHIESNGIGYNQGYTTLEGFFRTPHSQTWVPFLDVRYHIFNNGKPAVNAGLGVRHLTSSRIWGINSYYDYRKTNRQHYNQISVGLESLGRVWDFRINGYLPVGKKKSDFFDTRFAKFEDHFLYIKQKYEFAMKGVNAEIGAHVSRYNHIPLYFALGPYYLEGQDKNAGGVEARASADLLGFLRVEASTSYDNVFKWIGQGQISLVIPFGGTKKMRPSKNRSCSKQISLAKRAIQRVDRYEIIAVDRKCKQSKAINPITKEPYFFWFVNNLSHSDGTFESPFPTLLMAQNASSPNDVIYVYPGDGTSNGMDAGITLQDNQKLFGAGIDQMLQTTKGKITIPARANALPVITNSLFSNVIICGNNNEISGLDINVNGNSGISCFNSINPFVYNNFFNYATTGGQAVNFSDCLGNIIFSHNQLNMNLLNNSGILVSITNPQTTNYQIENNSFNGNSTASGIEGISISTAADTGNITIANNQFTQITSQSLFGGFSGFAKLNILNNTISQTSIIIAAGDMTLLSTFTGNIVADLTGNQWVNTITPSRPSLLVQNIGASISCISLLNNNSDSTPSYSLQNGNPVANSFILEMSNNIGSMQTSGTITLGTCP